MKKERTGDGEKVEGGSKRKKGNQQRGTFHLSIKTGMSVQEKKEKPRASKRFRKRRGKKREGMRSNQTRSTRTHTTYPLF